MNKSTTSSSPPKKASSSNAEKATLNSNFDLLSLNTSIPTKSAADKTSPKPTSISNIPTPKATATIANDLLCLGGTKLHHNTIILAKLKLLQSNSGKPLRIHDFFRPKNFHKFSRQIEVVNSQITYNRCIFTDFYCIFFNLLHGKSKSNNTDKSGPKSCLIDEI